jgi:DNA ligase (NAD+)
VELSERSSDSKPFEYITHCPECGSELIRYEGEAKHYCPNSATCKPQIIGRIVHFAGRKAMDINKLGDQIITKLVELGLIKNYADLYCLNINDLAPIQEDYEWSLDKEKASNLIIKLKGNKKDLSVRHKKLIKYLMDTNIISDPLKLLEWDIDRICSVSVPDTRTIIGKTSEEIINQIKQSTNVPFSRVLFALGIPEIGEATAKTLANHFKTLDAIKNASMEDLTFVEEIGQIIADRIINFFADNSNLEIIQRLADYGVQFEAETTVNVSNSLDGKTFVVSGKFSQSRDEIKRLIEIHGGKNVSSISNKLNYLLAGENMGPEKQKKAEQFNIPIISESDFLNMISVKGSNTIIKEQSIPVIEKTNTKVSINDSEYIQGSLF